MLALDDPRWLELEHAFGSATGSMQDSERKDPPPELVPNIPRRLEQLRSCSATDAAQDIWADLWELCHQGSIYTASYAAVPHILDISSDVQMAVDWQFFGLPTAIEISRLRGDGPPIPDDLSDDYFHALSNAYQVIERRWHGSWDRLLLQAALGLLAAAKGDADLAEALLELDENFIGRIIDGDD